LKPLLAALLPLAILGLFSVVACFVGLGLALVFPSIPLNQFISKVTLIFLLLSLWPAMRWLNLSWNAVGFARPRVFFWQLLKGFALGLATLLPVIAILYGAGVHVLDPMRVWTLEQWAVKTSLALLLALIISVLEEPLFRGVLLAGLAKKLRLGVAVFLSAVYYAALHFLTNKTKLTEQELTLPAAFELLVGAYANLFRPEILSALLALLMVGIFLGWLRIHSKTNIAWCIGCHAAWVWQIKISKDIFNVNTQSPYSYWVSSYDGVVGPLVTLWLALGLIAFWWFSKNFRQPSRS